MASTQDCKTLLETSSQVAHPGPFKRLSKKKADDGVERIFASADGSRFVRMIEDDNGALRIDRVGSALDDVAPSVSAPTAKSAPAKKASKGASASAVSLHAIDPDTATQAKLAAAVKQWCMADDHPDEHLEAVTQLCERHPKAALNQFVFALSLDPNQQVFVEVVPRVFWEQNKSFCDFQSVVTGILPGDEAESPNDSSTMFLHGFEDEKTQVAALLAAGVQWSSSLQDALNQMLEVDPAAAQRFNQWMQSPDLKKRLGGSVKTPPAIIDTIHGPVDLAALEALSTAPRHDGLSGRSPKNNPPAIIALIPCPDPASLTPQAQGIMAALGGLAAKARAYQIKLVLVPTSSAAFTAIQDKFSQPLEEWSVVGLHAGVYVIPGPPEAMTGPDVNARITTMYLGGLQQGLAQMSASHPGARKPGM